MVVRVCKWVGLLLSISLLAVWGVSTGYVLDHVSSAHTETVVVCGRVGIRWYKGSPESMAKFRQEVLASEPTGLRVRELRASGPQGESRFGLTFPTTGLYYYPPPHRDVRSPSLMVPLWIPFLLVALPTAYLWHRDRRIPTGHCPRCGYNLNLNVSGIYPECGFAIPNAA